MSFLTQDGKIPIITTFSTAASGYSVALHAAASGGVLFLFVCVQVNTHVGSELPHPLVFSDWRLNLSFLRSVQERHDKK